MVYSKMVKSSGKSLMGRRTTGGASFVESEGMLLTKPSDIAVNKIYALRQNMDNTDSDYIKLITNNVMLHKSCTFQFNSVDAVK